MNRDSERETILRDVAAQLNVPKEEVLELFLTAAAVLAARRERVEENDD